MPEFPTSGEALGIIYQPLIDAASDPVVIGPLVDSLTNFKPDGFYWNGEVWYSTPQ